MFVSDSPQQVGELNLKVGISPYYFDVQNSNHQEHVECTSRIF